MTVATETTVALRVLGTHWATPNLHDAGWVEEAFDLNPNETGFVALHLWNMGDVSGPAVPDGYFVDMGTLEGQGESVRIADNYIRPAIAAARAAGMQIFHVEPGNIAMKYGSVHHMLEDEDVSPPSGPARPPEANPGWNVERADRSHGAGYRDWEGWQQMRIIESCDAEPGDQVILTSAQFDRICRSKGIKNLIYTGFATNMCILGSAGATQPMLGYGYKVFLIREATMAVEYPDTFPERLMTRSALKYFQQAVGDTVAYDQFIEACQAVAAARR
jgi:nicotinamidase-related amidase